MAGRKSEALKTPEGNPGKRFWSGGLCNDFKRKKTKSFEEYKEKTVPVYRDKKGSIQRTVPIHRIARDGILQIEDAPEGEDKAFDKVYAFIDANYVIKDDDEQELYLKQYCKVLNALNVSFKIITMNNNRDMKAFMRDTLMKKEDGDASSEMQTEEKPCGPNDEFVRSILTDPDLTKDQYRLLIYCVEAGLPVSEIREIADTKVDIERMEFLARWYFRKNGLAYKYEAKMPETDGKARERAETMERSGERCMIDHKMLKAKIEDAIRQYEKAIAEFDAFIEEQGLGEEFAAFLERTERDIEEKKTVLDEAEDTNGDHDKAEAENEEEKKKDRNKSRMYL